MIVLFACEPVVDDKPMGGVVPEDQLSLVVESVSEGSNEILMENNTPGVGSYWDYVIGKSTKQKEVVRLPFLGETTITFTGLCDGGTVTTTRKVNVTKIDKPAEAEWTIFGGEDPAGKVWEWDPESFGGIVYGTAGYGNDFGPGWSVFGIGDEVFGGKVVSADEEMVFDLNGGANFTRRKVGGDVIEKGTFKFDMSKKKVKENGTVWSIGELQFSGATVLSGSSCWDTAPVYVFDIISLSDDKMVLAWAEPGIEFEVWNEATFWCFKAK